MSAAITVLVAGLVSSGGCGDSGTTGVRAAVRGEVRLDGQPLTAGAIVFHCGEGDDKVTAFGYIENGAYEIAKADGPLVGTARVEFRPKPLEQDQFEAAMDEAAKKRRRPNVDVVAIPPQYGISSNLTADVTEDGENKFDFDLKSRP
jgi:hypothetical protein